MGSRVDQPWIVTDDRIPYLVFRLELQGDLTAQELAILLEENLKKISNIYNCKAYSLSDDADLIACIKNNLESAIIVFLNRAVPLEPDSATPDPIWRLALRGIEVLNGLVRNGNMHGSLKLKSLEPQEISMRAG